MPSSPDYINLGRIQSCEAILAQLTKLETMLPKDGLRQFIIFNRAYVIVLTKVIEATANDFFSNPKVIEKFSVYFASYYFQAINYEVAGSPKLPVAWDLLDRAAERKNTPNFILLLMGTNAHINNDLPQALLKLFGQKPTKALLHDVLKIDKILMKSGHEIISAFEEPNKVLNFLKRHLVFLYYRPAMYIIFFWVRSWCNLKAVNKTILKNSGYEKRSIRLARRFLGLARILS
jgi:hypothetical protein